MLEKNQIQRARARLLGEATQPIDAKKAIRTVFDLKGTVTDELEDLVQELERTGHSEAQALRMQAHRLELQFAVVGDLLKKIK